MSSPRRVPAAAVWFRPFELRNVVKIPIIRTYCTQYDNSATNNELVFHTAMLEKPSNTF